MTKNDDDSYEPFYLGYARVVQSSRSDFLAVGPNGGRLRVSRGQVHLDSELDGDLCDVGSEGDLTVTRWWAQSRKLKEALPPPASSAPSPGHAPVHRKRSASPRTRNDSDTTKEGPMAPEGFTTRSSESREPRHSTTRSRSTVSNASDAPDGFTRRNS
jgi:hypothetical protein